MRISFSVIGRLALVASAAASSGCVKAALADGQISATREASVVVDTLGDYDVARAASEAGLVQFEGMHHLRPENTEALHSLLESWTGYGFAFALDDYEAAVVGGNEARIQEQKDRAKHAFDRAIVYGLVLLKENDGGFDANRKTDKALHAWLNEHFADKSDAGLLYWLGTAWMLRVGLLADDPAYVADLFIGEQFLERSRALDASYNHYGALVGLASYHARATVAELDTSKQMFEEALQKTGRKLLLVQLNYALRYACNKGDRTLYDKLIAEVVAAPDADPRLSEGKPAGPDAVYRLQNLLAKRRAARAHEKAMTLDCPFK